MTRGLGSLSNLARIRLRTWVFSRLICIAVLTSIGSHAFAEKRLTVDQLQAVVAEAIARHKPDAEIAQQVANYELSERLSEVSLQRILAGLDKGSKVAMILQVLSDRSGFLDLPAKDVPPTAAPDADAQQRMLTLARAYVAQTLPRLPNFLASRTISRFDDSPQALKRNGWPVRAGLHFIDSSSRDISVRDERENQPPTQGSAIWQDQFGLISGGEFGTMLGMILTDATQGKLNWSHWEEESTGPEAVFLYSVPKPSSHFEVIGSRDRADKVGFGSVTRGSRLSGNGVQPGDPSNTMLVHTKPSYHGAIWITQAPEQFSASRWKLTPKTGLHFSVQAFWCDMGLSKSVKARTSVPFAV